MHKRVDGVCYLNTAEIEEHSYMPHFEIDGNHDMTAVESPIHDGCYWQVYAHKTMSAILGTDLLKCVSGTLSYVAMMQQPCIIKVEEDLYIFAMFHCRLIGVIQHSNGTYPCVRAYVVIEAEENDSENDLKEYARERLNL